MQTEGALIDLWASGRSPGLVEAQRVYFLARLLHRAGRREEFAREKANLERLDPGWFHDLERLDRKG
jgi:hypothetical protein